jgi:hypothetical protein
MYNLWSLDEYQYPGGENAPYVLSIFPVAAGLAATASDGTLSVFDPVKLANGPAKRISTQQGTLSAARPYNAAQSAVATAGQDGKVFLWDLRQNGSAPALQLQGVTSWLLWSSVMVADNHIRHCCPLVCSVQCWLICGRRRHRAGKPPGFRTGLVSLEMRYQSCGLTKW